MRAVRLALRRLRRSPGFTFTAILTIALVLGSNGVIFSAVRGLLIRPLPFEDSERLMWIYGRTPSDGGVRAQLTSAEANALVQGSRAYQSVAVIGDRAFVREEGARRVRWRGLWVTPSLFDVLAVTPALGRPMTVADAHARAPVMLIGWERWMRDLGGDPSVLNRPLHFGDGHTFTLIGVLPRGLEFPIARPPQSGNGSGFVVGEQDFWILGQEGDVLPGGTALARLRPDAGITVAATEAAVISRRLSEDDPAGQGARWLEVIAMREQALGLAGPGVRLAQAFAIITLLLGCANLANLTLLRVTSRERETAIQAALGASRRGIVGGVLAETMLLGVAGGVLGLGLAAMARPAIRLMSSGMLPMLERIGVDWVLIAFTLLALTFVILLVSVAPAMLAASSDPHRTLIAGGRSQTADRRHSRLRAALVVCQVALALALSVGATLTMRSFAKLMAVDTGYDPSGVISADIDIWDHPQVGEFYRQLHARLRALPGIEAVGMIQSTPLTGKWTFRDPFVIVGRDGDPADAPPVSGGFVAFDYFEAMRIRVVAGRDFTEAEFMAGDAPSLVINESAARRFFPDRSPLGESVVIAGDARRIVGVVEDTRDARVDAPAEPQWYQPLFGAGTQLIVRTSGPPDAMLEVVRRELLASDPRLMIDRIDHLTDIVAATVIDRRMAMRLLMVFAAMALSLAALGLHGVLSFDVARRERELGIRSALGARRAVLLAMVLRHGLGLAVVGIAVGIALAAVATRALRALLFEVSPTEPLAIGVAAAVLLLVAATASLLPAWRAARADPAIALRAE